jgi:antiviral helicase SKI2
MDITDVPEGNVVRIINMVNEALRDLSNAAKIMGCRLLSENFDLAVELIKRDIIFATSLYFD